jgi:hypothetical protein
VGTGFRKKIMRHRNNRCHDDRISAIDTTKTTIAASAQIHRRIRTGARLGDRAAGGVAAAAAAAAA